MQRQSKIILAVSVLALGVLACQAVMGGGGGAPSVSPTGSGPSFGDLISSDDFSDGRWGTGTDTDSSIEYTNETLQMIVFKQNLFVWSSPPDDQDYENVHMEVTVINNNTDPTTAFGIMCNQQVIDDSFYYFAMTPAGQYAIARAAVGQSDFFLTNNNEWSFSDLIAENASSYRVGVDCGNGALTLYVDGQRVDSVSDSTYTNGGVALFTWSGKEATSADVSFDDFEARELR